MSADEPPGHLSDASRAWWASIVDEFELEPTALELLRLACEARDRAEQAREILEAAGVTVQDRFGQVKVHPCVAVERDAALRFARLVRELQLPISEAGLPEDPRPPRLVR